MSKFSASFAVCFCFLLNLAMGAQQLNKKYNDVNAVPASANSGVITRTQAAIWIPIVLAIIVIASVYALFAIDDKANRDTILYAKFLANLKDR